MVWGLQGKIYPGFPTDKVIGWPWWISVVLWFKTPYFFSDGVAGHERYITCKYFRGKCYILSDGKESPRGK